MKNYFDNSSDEYDDFSDEFATANIYDLVDDNPNINVDELDYENFSETVSDEIPTEIRDLTFYVHNRMVKIDNSGSNSERKRMLDALSSRIEKLYNSEEYDENDKAILDELLEYIDDRKSEILSDEDNRENDYHRHW